MNIFQFYRGYLDGFLMHKHPNTRNDCIFLKLDRSYNVYESEKMPQTLAVESEPDHRDASC